MTRRCAHDEDERGVSAFQHAHGQRCYWCWIESLDAAPEMTYEPTTVVTTGGLSIRQVRGKGPGYCVTCGAVCSRSSLRCNKHGGRTRSALGMLRNFREAAS